MDAVRTMAAEEIVVWSAVVSALVTMVVLCALDADEVVAALVVGLDI